MRNLAPFAVALLTSTVSAAPFELAGDWWQGPAVETRRTTLVASFDSTETNDADFARAMREAGGFGMDAGAEGKFGSATTVSEIGGHLNFAGGSNFQPEHGTLRMLVKGDAWADKTPRWFLEARGKDRIGIRREPGKLSLVFSPGRSSNSFAQLDADVGDVSTDEWHSIVASWDRASGTAWIALDGKGEVGGMDFSDDRRAPYAVYVGGGFNTRAGGMNEAGLAIDNLVLYDAPLSILGADLSELLAEEEADFLPVAEAGARKTLDFLADIQRFGGWQCLYSWPTLIGSSAQGREWADDEYYIDNDKGNGSPRTALNFLYGYEVLGDARYLDVLMRTAEFYLAAQDERGFWVHAYTMTVHGVKPLASDKHIKFQDQVQAHPMQLLGAVHRLTGDERYLGSVKKAGEFYIAAQNPNGSWSHHYDAEEGVGKNAIGQVGGGELNDRAMNDAIEMMALMYHLTGERQYVDAVKRAGDWLVEAQGQEVPLWADQYDADNNPAWAREFEPPAYGTTATQVACQALREVYRFSGDEAYVEAIRRTLAWLEENCPEGKLSCFTEPGTGRAIAGWGRKVYYLDDPDDVAYLRTQPMGSGYTKQINMVAPVRRMLEQAEAGPPGPAVVTQESALASLAALRNSATSALETQHESGVWLTPKVADYMGSLGRGFGATCPRLTLILRYIEAARTATGELEPEVRGGGNFRTLAYPEDDWYELEWEQ